MFLLMYYNLHQLLLTYLNNVLIVVTDNNSDSI